MARDHHDPITEADVHHVYGGQERVTRMVARGLLAFAIVWFPALIIVPEVFRTGAITSLVLATLAAVLCMAIMERCWLRPRAEARERRGDRPPPPRPYQSPGARLLRDARDRFQK